MRHIRIYAVLLLLAAEILWLSLQPAQVPAVTLAQPVARPGAIRAHGMTASVEQEALRMVFRLQGHPSGARPNLTVKAGDQDMAAYIRFPEYGETETSFRLSYAGVDKYPARVLTYAWEMDGKQVTGEYMYVHPKFRFNWQREKHGPFTFYHTGTLTEANRTAWTETYTQVARYLGVPAADRVVYVLPDVKSLQNAWGGGDSEEIKVAGIWSHILEAVLIADDFDPRVQRVILNHEFAHAFLFNHHLPWWEEGVATWVEGQTSRRRGVWNGQAAYGSRFAALEKLMQAEGTYLIRASRSQEAPLDPYTMGFSFLLYLESRFGEERVIKLALAAAKQPLDQAVTAVLGENLEQLERGWQEFVRNGDLVKTLNR